MSRIRSIDVALLAALSASALLLGFESVVRQSMREGEARRTAVLQQAAAWTDCGHRPGRSGREACRAQLAPPSSRAP